MSCGLWCSKSVRKRLHCQPTTSIGSVTRSPARLPTTPERYALRTRMELLRGAAPNDPVEPLVLSKDQRRVLAEALEERLAQAVAPTESIKLLSVVLGSLRPPGA